MKLSLDTILPIVWSFSVFSRLPKSGASKGNLPFIGLGMGVLAYLLYSFPHLPFSNLIPDYVFILWEFIYVIKEIKKTDPKKSPLLLASYVIVPIFLLSYCIVLLLGTKSASSSPSPHDDDLIMDSADA